MRQRPPHPQKNSGFKADVIRAALPAGQPGVARGPKDWPARPSGALILALDPSGHHSQAIQALEPLIREERGDGTFVIFNPQTPTHIDEVLDARISKTLKHWMPDLVVWAGDASCATSVQKINAARIPQTLLNLSEAAAERRGSRWPFGLRKSVFAHFDKICTLNREAANAVIKNGANADAVRTTGQLRPLSAPLLANPQDIERYAAHLHNRPAWLAIDAGPRDMQGISKAHRTAMASNHRLLLILMPQNDATETAAKFADNGWNVALSSQIETMSEASQVLVVDTDQDPGIWLRLSPVVFMGGSFDGMCRSPMDAASLGAAIVHGESTAPHGDAFRSLAKMQATHPVRSDADLERAVIELQAPDRQATLAHRAWDVATQAAPVVDEVLAILNDQLDAIGV
ncbi:3-deoxy-D-manno-octulosonic acid transferase [Nereida ignava]|uniref:3-deoxy-D-manno-octulosonic acid transferase n=1 Tax=Nereida ignava TaxID=282199 RepID=UPI002FE428C4